MSISHPSTSARERRHSSRNVALLELLQRMVGAARSALFWIIAIALWMLASPAFAVVPNPAIAGPIPSTVIPGDVSHNYTFFSTNHDLATNGYVEEEFFFQGTANRYNTPPLTTGTVIDSNHPYTTRMVVRRPADPARFNGTVLVEWYNVTNGIDAENVWFFAIVVAALCVAGRSAPILLKPVRWLTCRSSIGPSCANSSR